MSPDRLPTRLVAAFVALAVGGSAAFVVALARHRAPASSAAVERATVTVDAGASLSTGTLVSGSGLVLTAAHVVAPQAPGVALSLGRPARLAAANPASVTVVLATGVRYRARVAAVDGYLDLAVLALDTGGVRVPFVALGAGPPPGVGTGIRVVTVDGHVRRVSGRGAVASIVADPFGRVPDQAFALDASLVAAGSVGGAGVDDRGRVIGVVTAVTAGAGRATWRLRDAGLAQPLVDAARLGGAYSSPWLLARTGHEQVAAIGVGAAAADACVGGADAVPSGPSELTFGFEVSGVSRGEPWAALIVSPDQVLVRTAAGAVPEGTYPGGNGCLSTSLGANLVGRTAWPDGGYSVQLAVGPDLEPVGPVVAFSVG